MNPITIKTRSKAAYAIVYVDGLRSSIEGYAYTGDRAFARAQAMGRKAGALNRYRAVPIKDGKVTF